MTQATIADIHAASTDQLINEWCYSDAHKAVFGYRPRGPYTREEVVHFWIHFPEYWADMEAEDARYLDSLREKHGIHFETLGAYYSWWEKAEYERHCAEMESYYQELEEKEAKAREYTRRRSIIDVVRDFDYGTFKGMFA